MHLLQENARLYSLFIESYAAAMTIDTDKLAPPPEAANDTPASLGYLDTAAVEEDDDDFEPPPPSAYPLCTNEGRCGFLEAYIWRGEEALFEAVNHLWNELHPPKAYRCTLIGLAAGTGGTGKKALIPFLRKALRDALHDDLPQPWGEQYPDIDAFHEAAMAYFAASHSHYETMIQKYANLMNGDVPQ
jgi:hypothetical protein